VIAKAENHFRIVASIQKTGGNRRLEDSLQVSGGVGNARPAL
jgi:hypothetical protein